MKVQDLKIISAKLKTSGRLSKSDPKVNTAQIIKEFNNMAHSFSNIYHKLSHDKDMVVVSMQMQEVFYLFADALEKYGITTDDLHNI